MKKSIQMNFVETNLFDRICSESTLSEALEAVRKNKGAPGIDGVTCNDFYANSRIEIPKLRMELKTWGYQPQPVRRVDIPKPDGTGTRKLGIPSVRDRVVQAAIKAVLEPILDQTFSKSSYGFRPGIGQWDAVRAAQEIVQSGKEYVVDIDLEKFFDRVHHDRLIHRLGLQIADNKVLRLIGLTLRSGIMKNGLVSATTEGTVQGSPLSPLLSNVVLDELDKELESRGLSFCRYADDCNIFVRRDNQAVKVMRVISRYIEGKLKLVVNTSKSKKKIAHSTGVKFLGLTIFFGAIVISTQSMARAMNKVKEMTPRGTNQSIEASIAKIDSWYTGWTGYYKMTEYPNQLSHIEAHIRRRLRSRILDQQKRKRNIVSLLVKRGVPKRQATRTVYTNRDRWFLSHTKAVEKAFPNKWFEDLGLRSALSKPMPWWRPLNEYIQIKC